MLLTKKGSSISLCKTGKWLANSPTRIDAYKINSQQMKLSTRAKV